MMAPVLTDYNVPWNYKIHTETFTRLSCLSYA
jgi:hypothetical protein